MKFREFFNNSRPKLWFVWCHSEGFCCVHSDSCWTNCVVQLLADLHMRKPEDPLIIIKTFWWNHKRRSDAINQWPQRERTQAEAGDLSGLTPIPREICAFITSTITRRIRQHDCRLELRQWQQRLIKIPEFNTRWRRKKELWEAETAPHARGWRSSTNIPNTPVWHGRLPGDSGGFRWWRWCVCT